MKPIALVSLLGSKHIRVLESYLDNQPRVVITPKCSISEELRRRVSVGGSVFVALEELLSPAEIQVILKSAAGINAHASQVMFEERWASLAADMQVDAERVKRLISDRLLLCVQQGMIVIEALEKARRDYFVELVVVNEEWTLFPRFAVAWAKRHHIPCLHLAHAIQLVKAYSVHSTYLSDVVAVYGKRGAESLLDAEVPEERIRVTGNPAWDVYPVLRGRRGLIRQGIFTKYGLNPALPLVIFGTTFDQKHSAFSSGDVYGESLRAFLSACRALIQSGVSANFLVKDRPANVAFGQEAVARIADDVNLPREQVVYAMADTEALVVSADLVISIDSNLSVEALLSGVPAINLVSEVGLRMGPCFDGESGILDVNPRELATVIRLLLENVSFRNGFLEAMRAKMDYYNTGQDGKATERVAALMAELALTREGPERLTEEALPAEAIEYVRQADVHVAQGDLAAARQSLCQALAIHPHDPQLIVAFGNVLLREGNTDAARREFTKATVLHPEYAPAHADLAVVLIHQGRSEESELSARRALELDSTNISALKILAKICLDTERYQEAVQAYATILEHAPNDIETLILVGNCYAETGRREEAKKFYQRVLRLDPGNAIAAENLAIVDGEQLSFTRTSPVVGEAIESEPRYVSINTLDGHTPHTQSEASLESGTVDKITKALRCAEAYIKCENLEAASQVLTEAIAKTPDNLDLIVACGHVAWKQGDLEKARLQFVRAATLEPNHVQAHAALAMLFLQQRRFAEAEEAARKALAIDAAEVTALKVLAKICLDTERYQEAVQAYATILQHDPNDIETLILVGNCYAEVGRHEDAKTFYQRVLTLDPDNAVAAENLAEVDRRVSASDGTAPESLAPAVSVSHPAVSIVIVTYNSASTIRACLDSVLKESRPATELIIVDNVSTDETRSILCQYEDRITTILNRDNAGFSAACNQGIRVSTGEYIVLLNPDTVVTPGWLDRLIAHMGPGVGAVGPVSDYVAGLQKCQLYLPADRLATLTLHGVTDLLGPLNERKSVETKLLIGFCLMVPRRVLDEVGLLDEELFLGNDDLDLSWRLRLKGYQLRVATDTFVHHEGQVSFKSEAQTKTSRLVQESTDRLYAKLEAHYGSGNVPSPVELWGIEWFRPTKSPHPPFTKGGTASFTSIIILTYNGLEHTKKCLASIEACTPEPHELIIVDNGSTDGTLDYLHKYMAAHDNVRVIVNRTNRGFAAGNNQGLALARGDYLLLLNNDTIVTEGWLARMLQVMKMHPDVGVVGPMSNYVSGPQLVRGVSYEGLEGLDAFAAGWVQSHDGQSREATRVVGFCLLTRTEVVARVGGLDEQFGSGNFEDDDFCIRAFQVGFLARIALDVFVHHTGSQTFKAAKIDYRQSLMRNWELFKAKWGIPADTSYESGYHFPSQSAANVPLSVPLPNVGADHRCGGDGRWWQEIGEDRGRCEPAVTAVATALDTYVHCDQPAAACRG